MEEDVGRWRLKPPLPSIIFGPGYNLYLRQPVGNRLDFRYLGGGAIAVVVAELIVVDR